MPKIPPRITTWYAVPAAAPTSVLTDFLRPEQSWADPIGDALLVEVRSGPYVDVTQDSE